MWNVLFDGLLALEQPEGCKIFGYADVGLLIISGKSRPVLDDRIARVMNQIHEWSLKVKLEFSPSKTKCMMLKAKFERTPVVRLAGRSIGWVHQYKYLGIIMDDMMSFLPHVEYVSRKAVVLFQRLKSVGNTTWGLNFDTLKVLYRSVFESTVTYGSVMWHQRTNLVMIKRKLISAQRSPLLVVTKA